VDLSSPKITLYNIKSLIKIRVALGIHKSIDAQYQQKNHFSSLLVGSFPTQGGNPKCKFTKARILRYSRSSMKYKKKIRVIESN
jgi:hypothetical protein